MQDFSVARSEAGKTLAAVVRGRFGLTWKQANSLIESKKIKLAGQGCSDPARRVVAGVRIEFVAPKAKKKATPAPCLGFRRRDAAPIPEGISIVHADKHIVVVDKPSGLTTMRHSEEAAEFGKRGKTFLPNTLADYLHRVLNDGLPIIAVHRIDRDTSGLVVFARNSDSARNLERQFRDHSTARTYVAVCRGTPTKGRIESWLVRDRGDGRRGSGSIGQGQHAVTHVKVTKRLGPLSLIECRLETGRTHQIRIHLGEAGCPLAGERLYDRATHGKPLPDPSEASRIALHASTLGFIHPETGQSVSWRSPLPDDMRKIIERFSQLPD